MDSKGRCNVCGNELTANSVLCTKCETAHCEQCFTYAGNCSTYGCGSKAYRKQETIDIIYNLEDNSKTIDSKTLVPINSIDSLVANNSSITLCTLDLFIDSYEKQRIKTKNLDNARDNALTELNINNPIIKDVCIQAATDLNALSEKYRTSNGWSLIGGGLGAVGGAALSFAFFQLGIDYAINNIVWEITRNLDQWRAIVSPINHLGSIVSVYLGLYFGAKKGYALGTDFGKPNWFVEYANERKQVKEHYKSKLEKLLEDKTPK